MSHAHDIASCWHPVSKSPSALYCCSILDQHLWISAKTPLQLISQLIHPDNVLYEETLQERTGAATVQLVLAFLAGSPMLL
jgi:hypothetical protein